MVNRYQVWLNGNTLTVVDTLHSPYSLKDAEPVVIICAPADSERARDIAHTITDALNTYGIAA